MKQKLLNLWEHRNKPLVAIVALVLAFSLGVYVQSNRQAAQREEDQFSTLWCASDSLWSLNHLYGQADRSFSLTESGAIWDVEEMRQTVGTMASTLWDMDALWDYPDVHSYLKYLCSYLLRAECPDIESFGPLLKLSQPFMEGVEGTDDLEEALTAIADRLETERGQEIMQTLVPYYETDD